MELKEVINKRVSTREYSIEPVDKKLIEELVDCARVAPSAGNRQNWYFLILEGDNKRKVVDILLEKYQEKNSIIDDDATDEYKPSKSLVNSIRIINEVPIFILVFRKKNDDWKDGDYLSIGCAVEHMVLRATDLGLGSLWIRDVIYMKKEIAHAFGKEDMDLVTGLALGYSTEYPYERKKKELKDIMEWAK